MSVLSAISRRWNVILITLLSLLCVYLSFVAFSGLSGSIRGTLGLVAGNIALLGVVLLFVSMILWKLEARVSKLEN